MDAFNALASDNKDAGAIGQIEAAMEADLAGARERILLFENKFLIVHKSI